MTENNTANLAKASLYVEYTRAQRINTGRDKDCQTYGTFELKERPFSIPMRYCEATQDYSPFPNYRQ